MIEMIWRMGLQAGILILLVLILRVYLKKYAKVYNYLLWLLVLVRLLCPVFIESSWSLQPDWAGKMQAVFKPAASVEAGGEETTAKIAADFVKENKAAETHAQKLSDILQILTEAGFLRRIMKCIWGAGVLGVGLYFLSQYIKIKRQVRTAIWERGRLWRCDGIDSPFVMGVMFPKIYMPYTVQGDSYQYILQHEQMHIRHGDSVIRLAGMLAICLHWWNPLVWYGIQKMNQDMEMFCDESVLADSPVEDRKIYAGILLDFSLKQSGYPAVLSFGESDTERRVVHILEKKKKKWMVSVLVSIMVFALSAAFFTVPKKTVAESSIPEKTADNPEMYKVSGITQREAEAFIEEFINMVKKDQREQVSELVAYPRVVEVDGEKIYVENSTEFLQYYDSIFTDSLKETLYQCMDADIQYNDSGIFLGDGEVWIAKSGENLYITSLSNEEGVSVRFPMSSKTFYE